MILATGRFFRDEPDAAPEVVGNGWTGSQRAPQEPGAAGLLDAGLARAHVGAAALAGAELELATGHEQSHELDLRPAAATADAGAHRAAHTAHGVARGSGGGRYAVEPSSAIASSRCSGIPQ